MGKFITITMEILIGTSGWSYDDWVGTFYPERLRTSKDQWLGFYGDYLKTVEINSTFYRVPEEFIINGWVKKAKKIQNFEFSLKLPQLVTHEAIVKDSAEKAAQIAKAFEKKCIQPLAENGILGAILIQLSPYFRRLDPKTKEDNLPKLQHLFEIIDTDSFDYAIEFRHSSWLNRGRDDLAIETLKLLKEFNIANSHLDGPGFPMTKSQTASHGYIRMHGRNRDIWFKGSKFKQETEDGSVADEGDPRMNRYDYLYTEDELEDWLPLLGQYKKEEGKKARVYFNNHPNAQAIKNAFMLMDLLGMPRKQLDVRVRKQVKLDTF
ncbi:DUF72 domain-containing protein [[Eubacterium] cellulosolvens]